MVTKAEISEKSLVKFPIGIALPRFHYESPAKFPAGTLPNISVRKPI